MLAIATAYSRLQLPFSSLDSSNFQIEEMVSDSVGDSDVAHHLFTKSVETAQWYVCNIGYRLPVVVDVVESILIGLRSHNIANYGPR